MPSNQPLASLIEKGNVPFAEPYRLNDAGTVANRWPGSIRPCV